jgi:nitrate/nitrite transporter NarK
MQPAADGLRRPPKCVAVGFVARPLGGVLFGHIGDRMGRKRALTASVVLMAVPTVLIGLLPPHAQIGALAGQALVLLRLLQGLARRRRVHQVANLCGRARAHPASRPGR